MTRRTGFLALIAATALLSVSVGVSAGDKEEYTAPGASKDVLLHQQGLAAGEQMEARVIRFDLPPGHEGGPQTGALTSGRC